MFDRIHGGYNDIAGPRDDLYLYHTATNEWEQIEKPENAFWPSKRFNHAAGVVQNMLVIFGGTSGTSRFLDDYWEFDLVNRVWKNEAIPAPRAGQVTYSFQDSIIMHGGQDAFGQFKNDMWLFNTTTQKWGPLSSTGSAMPEVAYHSV